VRDLTPHGRIDFRRSSAVRRWVKIYRLPAQGTRFPIRMDIAAASLGIEHSVLISRVNRLERELGHRLLDRAPGQQAMQPTAYGQKVIPARS
jgi:hypothetical protein